MDKLNHLCPYYDLMDQLFGKKANSTPLAQFDAQCSNLINNPNDDNAGSDRNSQTEHAIEWLPSNEEEVTHQTNNPLDAINNLANTNPAKGIDPWLLSGHAVGLQIILPTF